MNRCIIMRGVPGSGKSTEASRICDEARSNGQKAVIHSTDNYFLVEGKYVYNADRIALYHKQNQQAAHRSMKDGVNVVVIDNTNTTAKEMYPYVEMAFDQDYEVEFVEANSPWWLAAAEMLKGKRTEDKLRSHARVFAQRNTHDVPEHSIMKMLGRYQIGITLDDVISGGRF